ncbi:iron ABC transporter permease [Luteolibacter flavescens]|uniref:Iron ABC transporter permease n=1 Tax=Luteolibacter flavescens TaxID=1859460 RepID=A0ABT3FVG2_9BACT|nr:iron ABC transporter permease [Luteolibacter flavescens]MCW1887558.1 iron ABC transporter permease [Luteolibacter flavescens]
MPVTSTNKPSPAKSSAGGGFAILGAWLPALLVLTPLLIILWRSFQPAGEAWDQIVENRLPGYLRQTLVLLGSVTTLAVLFGVPAAWFVSVYRFPGRRFFEVALLLPLAMPGFIAAVGYVDAFRELIPVYVWIRKNWGIEAFLKSQEIAPWIFGTGVLAATLFPYVYLSCRAVFARQAAGALEAARLLGAGGFRCFATVAMPMARPAVAAGASLVAMEAVNDFGVVTHFGLVPLTPGIFRAWNEGNLVSSMRLAMILLVIVVIALGIERWQRGRKKYFTETPDAPLTRARLGPAGVATAWLACGIPLLLGFLIPGWRLVRWTLQSWDVMDWPTNLKASVNSFTLAAGATLLILVAAFAVTAAHRALRRRSLLLARQVGVLGYAYPGALVAVGMGALVSTLAFDFPGWASLALSGSTFGLMLAYFIRFLAVAIQPASAGFERLPESLHDAGRTLGAGPLRTLLEVDLPLIRPALVAGAALVFIDVFKELTMTLVLRPFDFETLATLTFRLTDESRIPEAALPGLLMVSLSLLGLIPLVRLLHDARR